MGADPLADLEEIVQGAQNGDQDRMSLIESITRGLNDFMSERGIEQKSDLTPINEEGCIEADGLNRYWSNVLGVEDRVMRVVRDKKLRYAKSRNGRGIDKMIELAKAFGYNIMYVETPQNKDVIGKLGGSP